MAELADALDLGSSVPDVQVQVLSSALLWRESNGESSDFAPFFVHSVKDFLYKICICENEEVGGISCEEMTER